MTNRYISNNSSAYGNRSERSDFFIPSGSEDDWVKSQLRLEDGRLFEGVTPPWQKDFGGGEVVFNTGMTGYVESLTDPSYAGQVLVFTYPLIGNYGVQPDDVESGRLQVSGIVVNQLAARGSHSRSDGPLLAWLRSQDVPILSGVDTRALTKHLRSRGTMAGRIEPVGTKGRIKLQHEAPRRQGAANLPATYNPRRRKKIILVDCGAKENILRSLVKLPAQILRVPAGYDYTAEDYDGVVLSNGPGDPADYKDVIAITHKALKRGKPVFGICLGSQIMALAAGAKTYKLPYGHRGHNQPCLDEQSGRCYITSQNHGYAIDERTLPKGWLVSFRNLNDRSVEGIRHARKPFFSVQFHPEACPGPTDTAWLFEKFAEAV
jgi:carbamoyl-phosphate synthase small subunit